MNQQVSGSSGKGATATIVTKGAPPPQPSPPQKAQSKPKETPDSTSGVSFFKGRSDVFIICGPTSFLAKMYGDPKSDGYSEIGPLTIADLELDEATGNLKQLMFRFKQKGSRLYEIVEWLSAGALVGCHLSVQVKREDDEEPVPANKN
jgi:hypothetical protein